MQKRDPFHVDPLPRTFYYPSKARNEERKGAKIHLAAPCNEPQEKISSPADLNFLQANNILEMQEIPTRENGSIAGHSSSSQFNESWPCTENTISVSSPASDLTSLEMSQQMREWISEKPDKPISKSSLGWYINRFRNAPPTSRQIRDRSFTNQKHGELWWLSPPSRQSTPVLDTPPQKLNSQHTSSSGLSSALSIGKTEKQPVSSSSSLLQTSDWKSEEEHKRIESERQKNKTPIELNPFKKPDIAAMNPPKTLINNQQRTNISPQLNENNTPNLTLHKNPWPEDDILYQWRLMRKMEKAQQNAAPVRPEMGGLLSSSIQKVSSFVKNYQKGNKKHLSPSSIVRSNSPHLLSWKSELKVTPELNANHEPPGMLSDGHEGLQDLPTKTDGFHKITSELKSSTEPVERVSHENKIVDGTSCAALYRKTFSSHERMTSIGTKEYSSTESIIPPPSKSPVNVVNDSSNVLQYCDTQITTKPDSKVAKLTDFPETLSRRQIEKHKDFKLSSGEKMVGNYPAEENDCEKINKSVQSKGKQDSPFNEENQSNGNHYPCELLNKRSEQQQHKSQDFPGREETKNRKERNLKRKSELSDMVGSVIGKVVSEHVCGLDVPVMAKDAEPKPDTKSNKKLEMHQDSLLEESSEEEFPDDEILNMLRKRSKDLKAQLRETDELILNVQQRYC